MVDYFNIQRIHPTANEGVPGVEKKQVGIQKRDIVAGKPMTRVARQEKREKDDKERHKQKDSESTNDSSEGAQGNIVDIVI